MIWVPGDGTENLRANLYPIDVDGHRRLELVQFDGYRFIRVLTQDGRILWEVRNPKGRLRLETSWYWNLGGLSRKERRLSPYGQWTDAPVVVDLDRDGRDELVTWGRRVTVIGSRAPRAAARVHRLAWIAEKPPPHFAKWWA